MYSVPEWQAPETSGPLGPPGRFQEAVSRPVRGVNMSHRAPCLLARLPQLLSALKWCVWLSTLPNHQGTAILPVSFSLLLCWPWLMHAALMARTLNPYFRHTNWTYLPVPRSPVASHARVLSVVKVRAGSKPHKKLPVWPLTKQALNPSLILRFLIFKTWFVIVPYPYSFWVSVGVIAVSHHHCHQWHLSLALCIGLWILLYPRHPGYFLRQTFCPY